MKWLVLSSQIHQLGGAEKLAVELVHGLNKAGEDAILGITFTPPDECLRNTELVQELSKRLSINKFLDLKLYPNPSLITILLCALKLRKYLCQNNITHIETSLMTQSILVTLATLWLPIKHIVGFHQSNHLVLKNTKYKIFKLLVGRAKQNSYYGISNYVVKSWSQNINFKNRKFVTIYNSVDESLFLKAGNLPQPTIYDNKSNKLLYVGRITMQKGYHVLFDAVKNHLHSKDAYLFFLGGKDLNTDEEKLEFSRIQIEIEELALEGRVFFIDFSTNAREYIAHSDLVVHPTAYEGFGLVLIESLALKKPLITTNVEAIPEIIDGTGTTQLGFGDIRALEYAILDFLASPGRYARNAEDGYIRALDFRLTRRVNSILEFGSN